MDMALDQPGADQPSAGIIGLALRREIMPERGDTALFDGDVEQPVVEPG